MIYIIVLNMIHLIGVVDVLVEEIFKQAKKSFKFRSKSSSSE